MFVFALLSSISAYILTPKHALMITRTTTMPYGFSGLPQQRPFMEPMFIHRMTREEKPEIMNFAISNEKRKDETPQDPLPGFRKRFMDALFNNSFVSIVFFTISCLLFFFIGYQTRKSQERNSYVRLPATN